VCIVTINFKEEKEEVVVVSNYCRVGVIRRSTVIFNAKQL